ncbi:MBOAT family protein [Prevotella sp. HUN102]|uniref:MBOAT family O-acyltransferase n=1 Tax=Prevotella sp. HUN102 TaxID=1392486 RepID=UPI000491F842|nr:MBOAT family O-acyltransferase [Prevotella sp. HUN102]
MIDLQQTISALGTFLTTSSKEWSISTLPFMVAFLLFFAIYIGINHCRKTWMQAYVILFSLFFAFKANGALMLLLPAATVISWYLTKKMMRLKRGEPRKVGLGLIIFLELFPLLYYKYTNFGLEILNGIFSSNFALTEMILPIGISFYTFQAISYTIDVYKERFPKTTGLTEYSFYLTFFPLLIAGPITRAEVLIPQVNEPKLTDKALINKGLWLIICGLLKKCLIADYLAQFNNLVFDNPLAYSGFENLMGVLGYTLQIYCDFSGYSDMAIGLAALMGFQLPNNFSFPYQSLNLTEFWHRWHIALSSWFRDYIYIPLGGNRKGNIRTYSNSFLTMTVAGLWHGASGMFVIWGVLHGVGLIIHKFASNHGLKKIKNTIPVKATSWLITFTYVACAWVFFRAPNLDTAFSIFTNLYTNLHLGDIYPFLMARPMWLVLLAIGLELHSIRKHDYDWMQEKFINAHPILKFIILLITLQLIINFSQDNVQPFIYTQF